MTGAPHRLAQIFTDISASPRTAQSHFLYFLLLTMPICGFFLRYPDMASYTYVHGLGCARARPARIRRGGRAVAHALVLGLQVLDVLGGAVALRVCHAGHR